jgi:transcriptional regulator with XRE-family HTH domain
MISSGQLKAARALLGLDQREFAALCEVSLPTIQRMEASTGTVRGTIDSLVKIIDALDRAGVELIGEAASSRGQGRGVRLKETAAQRDAIAVAAGRGSPGAKAKSRAVKPR